MSAPLRVRTRLGSLSLTVEGDAGPVAALLRALDPAPAAPPHPIVTGSEAPLDKPPSYRIHKLHGRGVSVTDYDLHLIREGFRPEGLTHREFDEAKALARKLKEAA